jgi:rSAM/selenodomain-associated transferase 2
MRGRVSVIIPTLDEAERLAPLIERLRAEPELAEIIVADGGSSDGTQAVAIAHGARVATNERGRGQQLRAGAATARGDILLFLHADSIFPAGGLAAIVAALERDPSAPGGNFALVFDGETGFARWLTGFYALIRRFGLYYGDSGIFVRRAVYQAIGGIKPIPLMEDHDFASRLERAGPTLRIENPPLVTSSRKFADRVAIFCGWVMIHLLYGLGVSPERLERLYYRAGARAGAPLSSPAAAPATAGRSSSRARLRSRQKAQSSR